MPIIVPKTFKPKLFQPTINSDKFHYSSQALTLQPNKKNCIISLFAQTFRKFSRKMSVKLYSSFFFFALVHRISFHVHIFILSIWKAFCEHFSEHLAEFNLWSFAENVARELWGIFRRWKLNVAGSFWSRDGWRTLIEFIGNTL